MHRSETQFQSSSGERKLDLISGLCTKILLHLTKQINRRNDLCQEIFHQRHWWSVIGFEMGPINEPEKEEFGNVIPFLIG